MDNLQRNIGYTFGDKTLLQRALTHSSYVGERGGQSNERLEFLGDSVLGLIISDLLFRNFTHLPEGELTRLRAFIVCEQSLYEQARALSLGDAMRFSRGEEKTGGRGRKSILADAFEALIAAIYLDGGYEAAERFVLSSLAKDLAEKQQTRMGDYKSELQEIIQQNPGDSISYHLVAESGPDHAKKFVVEVHLGENAIGRGEGKTKKEAEQQAAREALELMGL